MYDRVSKLLFFFFLRSLITYLGYRQMNYEHFTLEVDFLHLRPAEVIRFTGSLKREDPVMVYSQVQLRSLMILKS